MSRFSWILLILLAILGISQIWRMETREAPSGTLCKENLLIQTISGKCTLRKGLEENKTVNPVNQIIK